MSTSPHPTSPIRFGTLGAAGITPRALIDPVTDTAGASVTTIAARNPQRAAEFANTHSIANVLDSYQEVVESDVDAVYIALPISEHHKWTTAALRAGKHVLCEKALAMDAAEVIEMTSLANDRDLILMEAYHYRYHPLFLRALEIIDSGDLGTISEIEGEFTAPIADKTNIRRTYALGGGATMDLGCYPIHWLRNAMGSEPEVSSAVAEGASADAGGGDVDESMRAELVFDGGVQGRILCSMAEDAPFVASLTVRGSSGSIEVSNLIVPQLESEIRMSVGGAQTSEQIPGRSTYHYQLDAFLAAIRTGTPPITAGADCVGNAKAIDAIYAASGLAPRRPNSI